MRNFIFATGFVISIFSSANVFAESAMVLRVRG